jgi:hypothetical protein
MKLTRKDVGKAAKKLLAFFNECNIKCLDDLEPYLKGDHIGGVNGLESIEVSLINHGNQAAPISIEYRNNVQARPLWIRADSELNLFYIMCTVDEKLQGYFPFASDNNNNLLQHKFMATSFYNFRQELEALASEEKP